MPLRQRMFHIGPLGFRVRIDRAVTGNGRLQSWVQLHRLRDGLRRVLGRRILPTSKFSQNFLQGKVAVLSWALGLPGFLL